MNNVEYEKYIINIDKETKEDEDHSKEEKNVYLRAAEKTKIDSKNSNNLLVYSGTFIKREILGETQIFPTFEENEAATYKKYIDIETKEEYEIPIDECEIFENEHLVIRRNSKEIYDFNEIRTKFFRGIMFFSQKEMVKKLLNENQK